LFREMIGAALQRRALTESTSRSADRAAAVDAKS
jgi:hypothetical protein